MYVCIEYVHIKEKDQMKDLPKVTGKTETW